MPQDESKQQKTSEKKKISEKHREAEPTPQAGFTEEEKAEIMQRLRGIAGLDIQTGLGYCLDEEDFYIQMLQEYMKADKIPDLERYFDAEDWNEYRITVHALKSTSHTLGAVHLSEEAKALEMAAKAGDTDYLRSHHKGMLSEYLQLSDQLKSILGGTR